ncbi:phage minor head protein [Roseospira visakhapatnamensis]|uniref:Phage head morphogenesis domain-containing protein n=1 Tax=Roseospira visakhapatnamensis TaxID=390880 RepID=A0A7W6RFT0_9PROT|nr:phage minor head protein [Roseospira visakhapatnamensis]MBB4267774.1 hypothetical protein [Roseospira visakhapatnamensis]
MAPRARQDPLPDRPGHRFGHLVDPNVAEFLRAKGLMPRWDYDEVLPEEHAFGFMAAKIMELDILRDLHESLVAALEAGTPFDRWARDLEPTLRAKGWWARREVIDPRTGQVGTVDLRQPWRLRVIYDSNMRSARAAGQYQRAQRTKAGLPYFTYELGPSRERRPEHVTLKGLTMAVDHPGWETIMPPNGWGCKCRVRQITAAEAARRGLTVRSSVSLPSRTVRHRVTGQRMTLPEAVDPAWSRSGGPLRARALDDALHGRLAALPARIGQAACHDLARGPSLQRLVERPTHGRAHPIARLADDIAQAIGARSPVVTLSGETLQKQHRNHPELGQVDYRVLPERIHGAQVIVRNRPNSFLALRPTEDGGKVVVALKVDRHGVPYVVSMYRADATFLGRMRQHAVVWGAWPED